VSLTVKPAKVQLPVALDSYRLAVIGMSGRTVYGYGSCAGERTAVRCDPEALSKVVEGGVILDLRPLEGHPELVTSSPTMMFEHAAAPETGMKRGVSPADYVAWWSSRGASATTVGARA